MKNGMYALIMILALSFCITVGGCDSPQVAVAPSVNKQATDFTLSALNGDAVTLSSLKGKKVLLDFFATWCPPCRRELVEINEIVHEYPKGNYEILCISVDDSKDTVDAFIKKHGYTMKVLFDDKNIAREYGVSGIPSLFLVDEDGNIVWQQAGAQPKARLIELLEL